jgi:hypothetical protein
MASAGQIMNLSSKLIFNLLVKQAVSMTKGFSRTGNSQPKA